VLANDEAQDKVHRCRTKASRRQKVPGTRDMAPTGTHLDSHHSGVPGRRNSDPIPEGVSVANADLWVQLARFRRIDSSTETRWLPGMGSRKGCGRDSFDGNPGSTSSAHANLPAFRSWPGAADKERRL